METATAWRVAYLPGEVRGFVGAGGRFVSAVMACPTCGSKALEWADATFGLVDPDTFPGDLCVDSAEEASAKCRECGGVFDALPREGGPWQAVITQGARVGLVSNGGTFHPDPAACLCCEAPGGLAVVGSAQADGGTVLEEEWTCSDCGATWTRTPPRLASEGAQVRPTCSYSQCTAAATEIRHSVCFAGTLTKPPHHVHLCAECAVVLDEEAEEARRRGEFFGWCQGAGFRGAALDWYDGSPLTEDQEAGSC